MAVHIGTLTDLLPSFLQGKEYSKIGVLVDNNTQKYCYSLLKELLPKHQLLKIKQGEEEKNLTTCEHVWQKMTDAEFDRHSLVINLGGGVIGDLGGFCAATYKRGIAFVQIPTTLLAQVDASVGGKLGIDFKGFKNHIGVFQQPQAVLIDAQFLDTLPTNELRSGFAEVVKHCLIHDAEKWEEIRHKDFEQQNFAELIAHSVSIKEKVVAQDPTEKDLRKILNFGHTLGHAVETHFLAQPKRRLLHGEAIAVGMICEAYLALKLKMIDHTLYQEIEEFIFSTYGKIAVKEEDLKPILGLTLQDKKNKSGHVRFALLNGRGSCSYDIVCSKKQMQEALREYMG